MEHQDVSLTADIGDQYPDPVNTVIVICYSLCPGRLLHGVAELVCSSDFDVTCLHMKYLYSIISACVVDAGGFRSTAVISVLPRYCRWLRVAVGRALSLV
jgi:hypothetical protein